MGFGSVRSGIDGHGLAFSAGDLHSGLFAPDRLFRYLAKRDIPKSFCFLL